MVKVFDSEKSVIDIVRESLAVNEEGTVFFKCREGRGSGKATEIPGGQFDEFVSLMVKLQAVRKDLEEQQQLDQQVTSQDSQDTE